MASGAFLHTAQSRGTTSRTKLLFSKKTRIVLISDAPFVFHLVARVARQGISAPYQLAFSCLPALASDTLAQMFGFNTHLLTITGGMAAIFGISRRRTTENKWIRRNYSVKKGGIIPPNTR